MDRGFGLKRECRRVAALNLSGGTRRRHGWPRHGGRPSPLRTVPGRGAERGEGFWGLARPERLSCLGEALHPRSFSRRLPQMPQQRAACRRCPSSVIHHPPSPHPESIPLAALPDRRQGCWASHGDVPILTHGAGAGWPSPWGLRCTRELLTPSLRPSPPPSLCACVRTGWGVPTPL